MSDAGDFRYMRKVVAFEAALVRAGVAGDFRFASHMSHEIGRGGALIGQVDGQFEARRWENIGRRRLG